MWDRIKGWDWETIIGLGWIPLLLAIASIVSIVGARTNDRSSTNNVVGDSSDTGSVYYSNCDAARSADAAPLYRGEPGYRSALDRDGDGVACEPYRGR